MNPLLADMIEIVAAAVSKRIAPIEKRLTDAEAALSDARATMQAQADEIADIDAENKRLKKALDEYQPEIDLSEYAKHEQIAEVYSDLSTLQERINAKNANHKQYVDGEVVRAGECRRFGIGGIFEATIDTAKSVFENPSAWLMISDGLVTSCNESGIILKTISGDFEAVLLNGMQGKEGQRGKDGPRGLRGDDGIGVESVEITERGIAVILTTGKVHAFNFDEPLNRAVRDVAPLIEKIAIEAVAGLNK